jgi:photosystem II stability/assembly factor-like uncharacterized protein
MGTLGVIRRPLIKLPMKKIIIIAIWILVLYPMTSYGQWYLLHPQDTLSRYEDVAITQDSNVFVCGRKSSTGIVIRSTDLGTTWDTTYFPGYYCHDFSFPTNLIGFVTLEPSSIYKTTDGGDSWNLIADSAMITHSGDIFFLNPDTGFCSYQDGGIGFFRTLNGGVTWTPITDPTVGFGLDMIGGRKMIYTNDALYNLGGDFFLKSTDYGISWDAYFNEPTYNDNYGISVINDKVWMTGMGAGCSFSFNCGVLSQSINEGSTWDIAFIEYVSSLRDIKMLNESIGYIISYADTSQRFLKTTDGGISWGRQPCIGTFIYDYFYLFSIDCLTDSLCFAVGDYGGVFRTINGGGQSTSIGLPENPNEYNVTIYPNPTTDFAVLEFDYNSNDNYYLIIHNSIGQEVKTITGISNGQVFIDAKSYDAGLYFCELRNKNRILGRVKLMIQ